METNLIPNKLDELVIETLRNYDARFDGGDWARMDRMLDVIPKSTSQHGSYNKAIIIGAAALLGIFLVFKVINSSKTSTETVPEATETREDKNIQPVIIPAPAPAPAVSTTPAPESTVVNAAQAPTVVAPPPVQPVQTTAPVVGVKEKPVEQPKKQQTTTTNTTVVPKEKVESKTETTQTTVPETKEKEATTTKGTGKVGLSGLLNLNMDSLRKQKEQTKTDTLK